MLLHNIGNHRGSRTKGLLIRPAVWPWAQHKLAVGILGNPTVRLLGAEGAGYAKRTTCCRSKGGLGCFSSHCRGSHSLPLENKEDEMKEQQSLVVRNPTDLVSLSPKWLEQKKEEQAKAELALASLKALGASEWRIERVTKRVRLLRKTVKALEAGFVPIPRFDSTKLTFDIEQLPLDVLTMVEEAKIQKVFDEFRFVAGNENERSYGRRRTFKRDPLVVGVIREPDAVRTDSPGGWVREREVFEEHFLIAWWRPEDISPFDHF